MTTTTTETVRLMGWLSFEEGAVSIRALLFGAMLERALPVVKEYRSDLFHDAHWLDTHVHGPAEFYWLVRHSGTNLNDGAIVGVQIGTGSTSVFYRIALTEERGLWSATFTTIPLDEAAKLPLQAVSS